MPLIYFKKVEKDCAFETASHMGLSLSYTGAHYQSMT